MPKSDAQEHREAMDERRLEYRPEKNTGPEYRQPAMNIVLCCSCKKPTDANDGHNVRIGIGVLGGVQCQTCHEAGKPMGRRVENAANF